MISLVSLWIYAGSPQAFGLGSCSGLLIRFDCYAPSGVIRS